MFENHCLGKSLPVSLSAVSLQDTPSNLPPPDPPLEIKKQEGSTLFLITLQ